MNARALFLILVSGLAGGCTTPRPVLDLADRTSANVAIVSARLRQLSAESNRLYANRADNISRLHGINATQRAHFAYDQALTRKAGQQGDLELMNEVQKWAQDVDQIFVDSAKAEKDMRDSLLAGQTRIDTKAQALQQVAETLSALAKQETAGERAKVLQKFVVEVRDDMDKKLAQGEGSAAAAKKLLDELRNDLAPKEKSKENGKSE